MVATTGYRLIAATPDYYKLITATPDYKLKCRYVYVDTKVCTLLYYTTTYVSQGNFH